ncbi:HU family DNA-binding protein [Marseilla massiliensis]|uniref:HU family DNA-binding protein n=1 Tax=Marseilla massiliensis TaxID=1841864 RepID=A0A938WQK4_9BACT|nr:HU family DNA-binding protein [Marseilla massiliensis]MBM6662885.1 HU family DNA-binding protein [Marseilla massiliensis]
MIDYSVYMMTPTYSKDETPKAYAKNQVSEIWSLEKFAKHISDHNGVYSRGTVKGVISDMCECLVEQLLNGNKIQLGELGTFGISISSEGAESIEKFTSKNIKAVNILFTPGADFENLIDRAEFNPVASRIAQKATLKAEKAGEATVDLEAAKNKVNAGGSQSTNEDEEDDSTGTGSTTVTPGTGGGGSSEDGGEE